MNEKFEKFRIEVSSDLDYEKMVVNINYSNNIFAVLNCDKGIDVPEIQIMEPDEDKIAWSFNLAEFTHAIATALKKLKEANE